MIPEVGHLPFFWSQPGAFDGLVYPHPRDHLENNAAQDLINHNKKVSLIMKTIKAGFHIIAMIAVIAGKNVQQSL